jgi:hypothetical protein
MDPEIPSPGIYPAELNAGSQGAIWTSMFRAALLTMAKRWKQFGSTYGWMSQHRGHTHAMDY